MEHLLQHIKQYHTLSSKAQQALYDCFEKKHMAKNELLLQNGQICRYLYFIEKGALRGFYNADGKEVTHWFGFENDFVTSFHSFITQQPAVENIQLTEHSILWAISKPDLESLLNTHHETERLLRIAYEKYYIRLEERFIGTQFKSAAERYENLLQQNSHILERMPLGYIASYLGITQETLSRIRSRF